MKKASTLWTSYKIRKICIMACPLPAVDVGVVDPGTNNGLNSYNANYKVELTFPYL